jgi:hypothetical protein
VVQLVAQVRKVLREGLPSNDNIEKADYGGTWAAAAVRFLLEESRTTTYTMWHSRPPFEIALVKSGRSPRSIPSPKVVRVSVRGPFYPASLPVPSPTRRRPTARSAMHSV